MSYCFLILLHHQLQASKAARATKRSLETIKMPLGRHIGGQGFPLLSSHGLTVHLPYSLELNPA